jgi:hypothetical protein
MSKKTNNPTVSIASKVPKAQVGRNFPIRCRMAVLVSVSPREYQ